MKKAIAVLINDIHLNKDNGELVKDIFHQLINICNEYKVDNIFCGGDVFTNRSGQPLQCLTDWKDILDSIQEAELNIHIIPGNHDKTDSNSECSYLDVYTQRCMHLYRNATIKFFNGVIVAFIPYFREDKWLEEFNRVDEEISNNYREGDIDDTWSKIIITHMGFDGVVNNDGSKVESTLKPSMFSYYDKVLVGHYHNASKVGKNVYYTGSAYQNNYGENITDKGFTIIYDDGSIKHIPSKFPKYIRETIKANDRETLINLIEKYGGEEYNHIRFEFVGKKVDCEKINISEIQNKYGIDCKIKSIEENEAVEISESDSVLCYDKKTIVRDFCKFCADNEIKGDKMKYGLNLIKNMNYVESD